MLREIFRFEWWYHTRQPAFIAASAIFFVLGFVLTMTGFGPQNVAVTSPWQVMESLAFISLFSVFAVAIFVSNAVLRDTEYRMEEIVFSTPVGRFHYLFGRFIGAFAAAASAIAFAPIGMMIATRVPWMDPSRVGELQLLSLLWSMGVMVLPSLLFATALLFAFATLTRNALATYTASVVLYFLYMVGAALTDSPLMAASAPGAGGGIAAALLDPFGLSAFFETTRYWTIAEKNHRFVALQGSFLANRALWTTMAAAIWGLTFRKLAFRVQGGMKSAKTKPLRPTRAPAGDQRVEALSPTRDGQREAMAPAHSRQAASESPVLYRRVEPLSPGLRSGIAAWLSVTRIDSAATLKSRPFLLLLGLWFGLAVISIRSDLFDLEYGAASYPTTALIVEALKPPLSIIGIIIVIYYGAELLWRDQRHRMASLIDATPVSGMVMALARWSAMVVLITATIGIAIAAGMAVQIAHGHWQIEAIDYFALFYFVLLPMVLYAAAAVGIHALSPGKYAGLMGVLIFAIATRRMSMLGLDHPLWRYASGPPVPYSAMHDHSAAGVAYAWLMLHWSVMAAGFLAIAAVCWRRLRESVTTRIHEAVRHVLKQGRTSLAALLVALSITGGWIFYNTNVLEAYESNDARLDWKADYERQYRSLTAVPQPRIVAVRTDVDIFPDERRLRIAGEYTLLNDTPGPIRTLHVSTRRDAGVTRLEAAAGRLASTDARFGMHRIDLEAPLAPGARTTLYFDLMFEDRGFPDEAHGVARNGTLVMSFLTYPSLGYRRTYELLDPRERAKRGLGSGTVREIDDPDAPAAPEASGQEGRIDLDATVSTSVDQMAFTSGTPMREWIADGRRYFRYRSDSPILNRFGFVSARYAVAHRSVGGVDLSIAYHPEHAANVEAMLETTATTLAWCEDQLGPYPHRQLRIVEVPSSWRSFGGYALPGMILLSETRAFLIDARDPSRLDLLGRRVAHEVAHQWFGHRLVAADGPGSSLITESLTKYVELMILERRYGRDHVRRLLEYELDRYLSGRSGEEERERTLAGVIDQPYLYYSKGALVKYAIRDLIGDDALNGALRRLIDEARGEPVVTSADLLRQLREVSSDTTYALIDAWIRKIVLYDFRVDTARVTPLEGARFRVTVVVAAARIEASADGTDHEVPLDESIDVALLRSAPDATLSDDIIAVQRVPMRSGMNEVSFTTDETPGYVAVDPWMLRIDRNRFDNARRVER